MPVRRLTWAFLGCLCCPPGRQHALAQSITESLPPEVPARPSLALPPNIDQFPFSSFISTSFQVGLEPRCLLAGTCVPQILAPVRWKLGLSSFLQTPPHPPTPPPLWWGLWVQMLCLGRIS